MRIKNNILALNAFRQNNSMSKALDTSSTKLCSGLRITKAADDSAGLSISEKMRAQIRGLNRASQNAQDSISFIQTTEGATNELQNILQRMRTLSVQSANDTNVSDDRDKIQGEIDQLIKEVDRIAKDTEYNTINTFEIGGTSPFSLISQSPSYINNNLNVIYSFNNGSTASSSTVGNAVSYTGDTGILADTAERFAENATTNIITTFTGLNTSNNMIGLNLANIDGYHGILASAQLRMGTATYSSGNVITAMEYSLNVDTSDFVPGSFDSNQLAATLTHEMMHMVMYDSVTSGMIGNNTYPLWFIEGMAQVAGGGMTAGHNQGLSSFTDNALKNYINNFESDVYGAGYLACMYLGAAANRGASATQINTANKSDIVNGLNKILNDLSGGKSLDEAISNNTSYTSTSDFKNKLSNDSLNFTKDLVNVIGSGAGSVLTSNLSDTTQAIKNMYNSSISNPKFDIDKGHLSITNTYNSNSSLSPTTPSDPVTPSGGGGTPPSGGGGTSSGSNSKLTFQIGANSDQYIFCNKFDVSSAALKIDTLSITDSNKASKAIKTVDNAINSISKVRSYYGAIQNRLEHTISNLNNAAENQQNAESQIRDLDMASEMLNYSKINILKQASQSMISQSLAIPQNLLKIFE